MRTLNLDGLVGPTHNYAGLSQGNVASMKNRAKISHPKRAALQGIDKMEAVRNLGAPQGIIPPLARPKLDTLRALGFSGNTASLLEQANRTGPALLNAVWSASSMWTANAATVTASSDAKDGRVHFTPANLASTFHRSLETDETADTLRRIFDAACFAHHEPIPAFFGDEGAANHTRLSDGVGVDVFVYGREMDRRSTEVFVARQFREASEAVARKHGVRHPVFLKQTPRAIDGGAFHNDVVAVGEAQTWLMHESAISSHDLEVLKSAFEAATGSPLRVCVVSDAELPLQEAVTSYLFNSQLLHLDGGIVLVAPQEVQHSTRAHAVVEHWLSEGVLQTAHFFDLRESMQNGGGPACLRLRVPLTDDELSSVHEGVLLTHDKANHLREWVRKHYRDELSPDDLRDPKLVEETHLALDVLTAILDLGSDFYPFQRA